MLQNYIRFFSTSYAFIGSTPYKIPPKLIWVNQLLYLFFIFKQFWTELSVTLSIVIKKMYFSSLGRSSERMLTNLVPFYFSFKYLLLMKMFLFLFCWSEKDLPTNFHTFHSFHYATGTYQILHLLPRSQLLCLLLGNMQD